MNIKQQWLQACKEKDTRFFIWNNIPTDRLRRLFAVACCEPIRHCANEIGLNALKIAELYADGLATDEELRIASENAWDDRYEDPSGFIRSYYWASQDSANFAAADSANATDADGSSSCRDYQGNLLEIMLKHNFNDNWKNDTTTNIAKSIYQSKNWYDLPILADALEDAGCTDQEVLNYCRSQGPFFRGCRILDELLELRK